MLVFLDTEFTGFTHPALISLALVAEDGREFYAERTDYPEDECNDFVRETVLPLLGRIPGAACNQVTVTHRLRTWFETLSEPATVVFDFERDWLLLDDIANQRHFKPPANFGEILFLSNSVISDPVFVQAQNRTYTQDWPPHHALADARALRSGWMAWMAEKSKQIQMGKTDAELAVTANTRLDDGQRPVRVSLDDL